MLEPSLSLLLAKSILIFLMTWLVGKSVIRKPFLPSSLLHWSLQLSVGISLLNLVCLIPSLIGGTARMGVVACGIWVAAYLIYCGASRKRVIFPKKPIGLFLLISLFALVNFLLPFIIKGTSGFYSRGGGDHYLYLSSSEIFDKNSFWHPIQKEETLAPSPHNQINRNNLDRQSDFFFHTYAIGNKYVASAFAALVPGSFDETYTATEAVYLVIAGWSIVSFFYTLLQISQTSIFLISGCLILLSNMLLYIVTNQSFAFLASLPCAFSGLVLVARQVQTRDWKIKSPYFLPLVLLSAGAYAIYSHLFLIAVGIIGLLLIRDRKHSLTKKSVIYLTFTLVAALLINLPLLTANFSVWVKCLTDDRFAHGYSWPFLFSTVSGLVDFGIDTTLTGTPLKIFLGLGIVGSLIILIGTLSLLGTLRKQSEHATWTAIGIFSLFLFGLIQASARGKFYQMIRFGELATFSGLTLGAFGLSILALSKQNLRRYFGTLGIIFLFSTTFMGRLFSVQEVLGVGRYVVHPSINVDMKDSESLKLAKFLEEKQKCTSDSQCSPIVYYFGSGYGSDDAGITTLLRKVAFFPAYGIVFDDALQTPPSGSKDFWDPYWLNGSLWVVSETRVAFQSQSGDIFQDHRQAAPVQPQWRFGSMDVYDTREQYPARLIGSYWHPPISQVIPGIGPASFRYLKGHPGVLAIFSKSDENVTLDLTLSADAEGALLELRDSISSFKKTLKVPKWQGSNESRVRIQQGVRLKKGLNILVLEPKLEKQPSSPWLMFWNISLNPS